MASGEEDRTTGPGFSFALEYVKERVILSASAGFEYSGSHHEPRLVTTSSTWYLCPVMGVADTRSGPRFPAETKS